MSVKDSHAVPKYFQTERSFRKWLEKNHRSADVLWVGYHKKSTGKSSIDWEGSRDQALCFGWIDGIRKSIDNGSFMIRFTPRRPGSMWSAINIARVRALRKQGLMAQAGIRAFQTRDPAKSQRYSFEQMNVSFTPAQLREIRKNGRAWEFFVSQPPSYRRMSTWWVTSAKKVETQERRLRALIRDSSRGLRIAPLRRTGSSTKA